MVLRELAPALVLGVPDPEQPEEVDHPGKVFILLQFEPVDVSADVLPHQDGVLGQRSPQVACDAKGSGRGGGFTEEDVPPQRRLRGDFVCDQSANEIGASPGFQQARRSETPEARPTAHS